MPHPSQAAPAEPVGWGEAGKRPGRAPGAGAGSPGPWGLSQDGAARWPGPATAWGTAFQRLGSRQPRAAAASRLPPPSPPPPSPAPLVSAEGPRGGRPARAGGAAAAAPAGRRPPPPPARPPAPPARPRRRRREGGGGRGLHLPGGAAGLGGAMPAATAPGLDVPRTPAPGRDSGGPRGYTGTSAAAAPQGPASFRGEVPRCAAPGGGMPAEAAPGPGQDAGIPRAEMQVPEAGCGTPCAEVCAPRAGCGTPWPGLRYRSALPPGGGLSRLSCVPAAGLVPATAEGRGAALPHPEVLRDTAPWGECPRATPGRGARLAGPGRAALCVPSGAGRLLRERLRCQPRGAGSGSPGMGVRGGGSVEQPPPQGRPCGSPQMPPEVADGAPVAIWGNSPVWGALHWRAWRGGSSLPRPRLWFNCS